MAAVVLLKSGMKSQKSSFEKMMDVVCEQGKHFGQGISLQLSDCHSYCSFLDDCFVMATEPSWSPLLFHADQSPQTHF